MNRNQKQALKGFAVIVVFKLALYVGIYYAAKTAREAVDRYK